MQIKLEDLVSKKGWPKVVTLFIKSSCFETLVNDYIELSKVF